jgi:hypothetical protein
MNMFSGLLGGMVDTEKITFDTIQSALEDVAEELGCSHKELFIKIAASDEEFSPIFHIFKTETYTSLETIPRFKFVREITLKEILGKDD